MQSTNTEHKDSAIQLAKTNTERRIQIQGQKQSTHTGMPIHKGNHKYKHRQHIQIQRQIQSTNTYIT